MGKVNDTAAATASRPTAQSSTPKVPTSEQLRMAQLLVDPKSEDHSSLKDKVHKVMELTRCDENSAFIALHDCDNDVGQAVMNLLEGDQQQDEWIVQEGKKTKKIHQLHQNADDTPSDETDRGKPSVRRQRGGGGRGGGINGASDGPPRLRGRGAGAGTARGSNKGEFGGGESGEFGGGERGGFSKGRGRGGRDGADRGGRGRGFGGRGARRGGGGFVQSDGGFIQSDGGGGGFDQIDSWNVAVPDNNTWDNSMANVVSNGPAGEWGKRKAAAESNTWDNSMANAKANVNANPNPNASTDYDWGGEEDWSKLREGMVIEPSTVSKGPEKSLPFVAPSSGLVQSVSPAPQPQADPSRVRGESIDVNSLFGSNQPVPQPSASSSNTWTTSRQATADLKNELGIGKLAPVITGESTSHVHNRDPNKPKVELPSTRTTVPTGPIDVQFGDMTLGSDAAKALFDIAGFQLQNNSIPVQPKDQSLNQRPQQTPQPSAYPRAAGGDHLNGPDLLNASRTSETVAKDATPFAGPGTFASQGLEQNSMPIGAQQQKPFQQQPPQQQQQQFAPNRNANQSVSALPQRAVNSGNAVNNEHQRQHMLPNAGPASIHQQTANNDSVGVQQQYSRDENLVQMNMGTMSSASTVPALSKTQVSAGTINQPMAPYQQAMTGLYPYSVSMPLDQASLNYLQTQNLLFNAGGYDIRTVSSLAGANMAMGRDNADMKAHMMRQENGSVGNTAPHAGAGNLNMPPPGLPGPTVSNAEAAAMAAVLFPQYQSLVNYPPSGSPYMTQPQFYVPSVTSASAPGGGNQYQRGGYQPAPALFGTGGYEELQQMTSQADYGKTNYAMPPPAPGKSGAGGSGSGGANDVGNKYGGGMKGPYDSKQFVPATATPPPQLANMNYTQAATAPYGYSGYMPPPGYNMMPGPAMPSNAQVPNDLLNQRSVNQNGKPPGGPSGVGKGMTQQYQYATPWGN